MSANRFHHRYAQLVADEANGRMEDTTDVPATLELCERSYSAFRCDVLEAQERLRVRQIESRLETLTNTVETLALSRSTWLKCRRKQIGKPCHPRPTICFPPWILSPDRSSRFRGLHRP